MNSEALIIGMVIFFSVRALSLAFSYKVCSEIVVMYHINANTEHKLNHPSQLRQPTLLFLMAFIRFLFLPILSNRSFGDGTVYLSSGLYQLRLGYGYKPGKHLRAYSRITEYGPEDLRGRLVVVDRNSTFISPRATE